MNKIADNEMTDNDLYVINQIKKCNYDASIFIRLRCFEDETGNKKGGVVCDLNGKKYDLMHTFKNIFKTNKDFYELIKVSIEESEK